VLQQRYIAYRELNSESTAIASVLREVTIALNEPKEVGELGAREIEKAHAVNIPMRCDSYRCSTGWLRSTPIR
jgi:hypothetical protein